MSWWLLAIGVALIVGVVPLALAYAYRRLRPRGGRGGRGSKWRVGGDGLTAAEAIVPLIAIGIAVTAWGHAGPLNEIPLALELSTAFALLSTMLAIVLWSSTVDWFYIRPQRDGLISVPPCKSSGEARWSNVTKNWLRHRFIAETSFVLFFIVTGPVLIIEAYFFDSGEYQWISRVISPIITVLGVPFGYSKTRLRVGTNGMTGINSSVKFALGDTISWSTPKGEKPKIKGERRTPYVGGKRLRLLVETKSSKPQPAIASEGNELYVFDVGLDEATLFKLRAARTKHSRMKEYKAPMSVLLTPGIIDRRYTSPCIQRCLAMHDRCAWIEKAKASTT